MPGPAQKTFKGYAVTSEDPSKWADFSVISYQSKTFTEDDVEIEITHCGVCGSDVHTLTQGWGKFKYLPLVVGHEVAGTAVRVGKNVPGIKKGDRVGVGAQIGSCLKDDCKYCGNDNENYCPKQVDTYNAEYPNGEKTMGGYSNGIIAHHRFTFPIPDGVKSEDACSMLCGGLTVFSPLVRNGTGPGKKVGIIGIGGLGHYAVLFAKALGAKVYAFTHSDNKTEDIKKMGADEVVVTNPGFEKNLAGELDLIVSTRDSADNFPMSEYLSMLTVHGKLITVGIPDQAFPSLQPFDLASNGCFMGGSHIGSKKEALQMLDIAAKKGVKPWIEVMPMKEASKAVKLVHDNKVRYRYVLAADIDE